VGPISGEPASRSTRRYRFADLTFDLGQHRLWRAGEEVTLSGLSYELMRVLVEAAPNLVTHDELAKRVWGPRRVVTPENLAKRVMMLRQALGDQVDAPRYIEGVRGQGYRLMPNVEIVESRPPTESPRSARKKWKVAYGLAVLGIAALALFAADRYARMRHPSVAVLPCENHSVANEDAAFIGVGLRSDLLARLDKIRALRVVESVPSRPHGTEPRSSSEIGNELGVASLLACTVQRAADALLVSVQLLDTKTGDQLWAERYEAEFTAERIFDIQRDIATSIAAALRVKLTPEEVNGVATVPTRDIRAYDLYLAASTRPPMNPDDAKQAIDRLNRALELDTTFAEAMAMRASLQALHSGSTSSRQSQDTSAQVRLDAKRAVELRPRSCLVRLSGATTLDMLGDWVAAEREYRASFDFGCPRANLSYAEHNLAVGDFKEARRNLTVMVDRDRIHPNVLAHLLASHGLLGDTVLEQKVLDQGNELHGDRWFGPMYERYFRMAREPNIDPTFATYFGEDLSVYVDAPRDGAAAVARLSKSEVFSNNIDRINLAYLAAFFDDDELAVNLLKAAFSNTGANEWFIWMPLFHNARRRPEFVQLLRDQGLVAYWDKFGWPSTCGRVGEEIACN
jgi:TolB-like protein/DNA-binding winged helix-turn-helix (wHTH) protein